MPKSLMLCLLILTADSLTACGQKGSLYLPENTSPTIVSPTANPADTAEQVTVTGDAQNPNVTDTDPTNPQTTAQPATTQGDTNDY